MLRHKIRTPILALTFITFAVFPSSSVARLQITSAPDDSLINPALQVQMQSTIQPASVPLNRHALLTVRLQWSGRINDVEFDALDSPQLTNLKLIGSSSANWTGSVNNAPAAARIYEFQLQPESLGMGYVEAMRISYLDKATGQRMSLFTMRLGIEGIDALPEPGNEPLGWIVTGGLIFCGMLVGLVLLRQKRIEKREAAEKAAAKPLPLEQKYLDELRQSVNLNTSEINAAFAVIYKLMRRYLAEKFAVSAQGTSTEEALQGLRQQASSEEIVLPLAEVLQTCDLYKYSGESGDPSRLARVYALVENILQRNLNETAADALKELT